MLKSQAALRAQRWWPQEKLKVGRKRNSKLRWRSPEYARPEPKTKVAEPTGWQEAYRRMSRSRYGIEDPEVYAYWKNVPPSVRLDVLAELGRPTTEGKPAGQPAAVDFKQARAAVQNVGKLSKEKA